MGPADLSTLKSELLSLEKLIHEPLHRQSQITSRLRLAGVELPVAGPYESHLLDHGTEEFKAVLAIFP